MIEDEIHFQILKNLEADPEQSQRDLAKRLDVSLGKVNYCLKALMQKGLVKAKNFKNAKSKLAYIYRLTPSGIEERARLTKSFLQKKMTEYDRLKVEIDELKREVGERVY